MFPKLWKAQLNSNANEGKKNPLERGKNGPLLKHYHNEKATKNGKNLWRKVSWFLTWFLSFQKWTKLLLCESDRETKLLLENSREKNFETLFTKEEKLLSLSSWTGSGTLSTYSSSVSQMFVFNHEISVKWVRWSTYKVIPLTLYFFPNQTPKKVQILMVNILKTHSR